MNKSFWLGIAVLLLVGLGIFYFRPFDVNRPNIIFPPKAGEENKQVRVFNVEAKPFEFTVTETGKTSTNPKEIRVKKGETVQIMLKNTQGFHDWVLEGYNVKTSQIQAGQTDDTVKFVADKIGKFKFYCSVGNHRQMGMEGDFIVE